MDALFNAFPDVANTSNLLGPEKTMTALAVVLSQMLIAESDAQNNESDELVLRILAANPGAAKVTMTDPELGHFTPLYMAVENGCNPDTIAAIAAAWPEASKEACKFMSEEEASPDEPGDYPINALIKKATESFGNRYGKQLTIHPTTMLACLGITTDVAAEIASLKASVSRLEGSE